MEVIDYEFQEKPDPWHAGLRRDAGPHRRLIPTPYHTHLGGKQI